MSKPLLIKVINGIIDANSVGAVTITKSGVAVTNAEGKLMYWHEEMNIEKCQKLSALISDAVMDRLEGGDGKIDFAAHGLI